MHRSRAPRGGIALTLLTAVTSIWWYAELRLGDGTIVGPSSRAPLGPLDAGLPLFEAGSTSVAVAMAAVGAAILALLTYEWRALRTPERLP